jgi:hypothetical protein
MMTTAMELQSREAVSPMGWVRAALSSKHIKWATLAIQNFLVATII